MRSLLGVPIRLSGPGHHVLFAPAAAGADARAELHLRLVEATIGDARTVFRTAGTRLEVESAGFSGRADRATLSGTADVAPALLSRPDQLDELLLPLALWLVTWLDRQPVHAACISRGAVTLLLEGPSGSGKSTLSYAAGSAGWTVHSDDAVYVQREPPGLWTHPRPVHVREQAARYFETLQSAAPVLRENGLRKLPASIATTAASGIASAQLCLLQPSGGAPRVDAISRDDAVDELVRRAPPGFDMFSDSIGGALARVTADPAWRVCTGDDPAATIALLTRTVAG